MHPTIAYIRRALQGICSDSEALSIAKLLLTQHFGFTQLELYGGKDRNLSVNEQKEMDNILRRLQNNEPVQYVLGRETFCDLTFEVNPNVLISRPETQELVEWIVKENLTSGLRILDIGTGSGCIAISLAKKLKSANVTAWDISESALQVARRNAELNGVNVCFKQIDVLSLLDKTDRFDMIVSNPPYVTNAEKQSMERNVLDWEPEIALFVSDDDPFLFYKRIADVGIDVLSTNGKLYFEINQHFGKEIKNILENKGYHQVELRKDMFGNDRMIKALI